MKIKKTEFSTMIREAVQVALGESGEYDETGELREKPEEKKARLDGKKQAVARLAGKPVEELKQSYLKIEAQAEAAYQEPLKHAFLWGALDQIAGMLKKQGQMPPKKNQSAWTR